MSNLDWVPDINRIPDRQLSIDNMQLIERVQIPATECFGLLTALYHRLKSYKDAAPYEIEVIEKSMNAVRVMVEALSHTHDRWKSRRDGRGDPNAPLNAFTLLWVGDRVQAMTHIRCGMTTYSPEDIRHRYCEACHTFMTSYDAGQP